MAKICQPGSTIGSENETKDDENFRIALKASMNIQNKSLQIKEDMIHVIKGLGGVVKLLQVCRDK